MTNNRYSYQAIEGGHHGAANFRIADAMTDDRIATCYLEENARLVTELMNRGTHGLNSWRDACWKLAEDKGFHDGRANWDRDDTLVRLCLLHTEVSEAAQLVKKRWADSPTAVDLREFGEELADVFIRLADLCCCVGVDLDGAVRAKMAKNAARPHLYGTPWTEKAP